MHQLRLRDANRSDLALTYEITEDAMRGYIEETWGKWDSDDQFGKHERSFTPDTHKIVLFDGDEAGFIAIEDFPSYTWLVKLYLRTAYRGHGIGSQLLNRLIAQATEQAKPLRLQVLRVNTRAQRLYTRHGFKISHETPERIFMEIGA